MPPATERENPDARWEGGGRDDLDYQCSSESDGSTRFSDEYGSDSSEDSEVFDEVEELAREAAERADHERCEC